jgi:GNAT superfamily N-acetyltransferase
MIVRKMLPHEIDITVNLCRYYADEAEIAEQDYDENSVLETVRTYTIQHEYTWLNAFEGQRPVGLIAGCITKKPWNKDLVAHIDLVFLLESHRNLANFKQLISAFEEWARTMQCKSITAGDIGINVDRTRKLYEHFGFTEALWMNKEISQ